MARIQLTSPLCHLEERRTSEATIVAFVLGSAAQGLELPRRVVGGCVGDRLGIDLTGLIVLCHDGAGTFGLFRGHGDTASLTKG